MEGRGAGGGDVRRGRTRTGGDCWTGEEVTGASGNLDEGKDMGEEDNGATAMNKLSSGET